MSETKKAETEKEINRVRVKLPRMTSKDADEHVIINGLHYIIKRGVEVEVPENVAEVLAESERMKENAIAYEMKASNVAFGEA